jgi:hypothetical protein
MISFSLQKQLCDQVTEVCDHGKKFDAAEQTTLLLPGCTNFFLP